MKVELKTRKEVPFSELKLGDVFLFCDCDDEVFVKTSFARINEFTTEVNSCEIISGNLEYFDSADLVMPINGKFVEE